MTGVFDGIEEVRRPEPRRRRVPKGARTLPNLGRDVVAVRCERGCGTTADAAVQYAAQQSISRGRAGFIDPGGGLTTADHCGPGARGAGPAAVTAAGSSRTGS